MSLTVKPTDTNTESLLNLLQSSLSERGAVFGDMLELNFPRFEFKILEELMGGAAMLEQHDCHRSRVRSIASGVTTLGSKKIVPIYPRRDASGDYGTYSLPAELNPDASGEIRKFSHAGNDIWDVPAMLAAVQMMKDTTPFKDKWSQRALEVEATYIGYRVQEDFPAVATPDFPHFDKIDNNSISGVFLLSRENVRGGENFLIDKNYVNTSMKDVPASAVLEARTLKEPGQFFVFHETGEHPAHHVMPIRIDDVRSQGYRSILTIDIRPTFRG